MTNDSISIIEQANHWLQYFFSVIVVTSYVIYPKIVGIWEFFNNYVHWRTAFLVFINFLIALSLSKDIPELIIKISNFLKFSLGNDIADVTGSFIFRLVFLIGIILISDTSGFSENQITFIALISKSLIVFSGFLFFDKLARLLLIYAAKQKLFLAIKLETIPVFEYISLTFLIIFSTYLTFNIWNIEMTALLASAGIMGLAISMAAKDTLADVIAGILILIDAPFKLGDMIEAKGQVGEITQIGIRSIRIMTPQNIEIVIPNGKMGNSEVVNKTAVPKRNMAINLPIKVAYGVNPEVIREILINVAKENKNIMPSEKITVTLDDFNQMQTTFTLSCRVIEGSLQNSTLAAMREKIYLAFLEHQIEVALPVKEMVAITTFPSIFNQGQPRELPSFNNFKGTQ
jgi:small-conductance mechanosensitive channel